MACLATGLPWCVAGLALGTPELTAAGAALAGFAVLTALADGKLPALKQAELTLLVRRRHRVSFRRLLDGAVDRRVLVAAGGYYRFRDPSVQDYLLGRCQAAAGERQRRIAARKQRAALRAERIAAAAAGKHGVRPWLLGWVSPGAAADPARGGRGLRRRARHHRPGSLSSRLPGWHSASAAVFGSLGVLVAGLALFVAGSLLAGLVLDRLAWGLRWSLWLTGRTPAAGRVAAGAVSVAAAGGLTWLAGLAAVRHGIGVTAVAVMPAVTVAAVGGWAAVLVHRRCRDARRRPVRYGGDAMAAAVAAVAILLLVDRNLLGAQAAAGLFPGRGVAERRRLARDERRRSRRGPGRRHRCLLMLGSTLRARGELAAYRAVTRAFTLGELPVVVPLADLVLQIDRTSKRGHDGRPAWNSTWPGGSASCRR